MQGNSKNKSRSFSNSTNVKTYDSAAAVIKFSGSTDSNSRISSSDDDDFEKIKPIGTDPPPAEESIIVGTQNGKTLNAEKGRSHNKHKSRYESGHPLKAQLDVKAIDEMSDSSDTNSVFSLDDSQFADITDEDLGLSEDHFSRPEGFFGYSKVEELELAIENCKEMVRKSDEHSEQRRTLVNKLVQLRMKLLEVKFPEEDSPDIKVIVGHRFRRKHGRGVNHQCESCNSLIWRMLQSWYRCIDCGLNCHSKCLNLIKRECVSRKLSGANYSTEICPEIGLSAQNYRCAECKTPISFKDASDIRQCDYSGKFFCTECHWNDTEVIPARVLHNWDFEPRKVCRQSKQFLQLMMKRAVLKVDAVNDRLFNYVEELSQLRKLREEILIMKSYFLSCRNALEGQLLLQLNERRHFVESFDMYSLKDLIDLEQNSLLQQIEKIHSRYVVHIKIDCQLCQGKGYICELCGVDEIIYPFDIIASRCRQCRAVFHRDCFYKRGNQCPKCLRLSKRQTVIGLQRLTSPT
ncbi:differentially expressed in FDCP 8 homolog B-like isoform X2 [Anneissia japonica]|uniref:differentially expressed in FDCP 8 homolog B-like isoform X2 n=1 Tax=Anneissia japonica TaxID=1529436 RepID=UPI00142571B0|nr:differentially expressed in FDCP 8 homolog B-like isoform X2 [Anneissia japonica]